MLHSVFHTLKLKHAYALVLSLLLVFLIANHMHFRLIPLWVLHFHPDIAKISSVFSSHSTNYFSTHLSCVLDRSDLGNFSSNSTAFLLVSSGHAGSSVVVVYRLPKLHEQKLYIVNREQKESILHRLVPVSHLTLADQHVLATAADSFGDHILFVIVTVPADIGTNITDDGYQILLINQTAHVLWKRYISLPTVATGSAFASISIDSTCGRVSGRLCGSVFVTVPTHSGDVYEISTLALLLNSGEVLWLYRPEAPRVPKKSLQLLSSKKHWKLALLDQYESHSHVDESAWQIYQQSLKLILPIQWYGVENSRMVSVHALSPTGIRVSAVSSDPVHANTLLSLHPHGVDVFDQTSGKLLARLSRNWKPGSTYAILPSLNTSGYFSSTVGHPTLHELRLTSTIVLASLRYSGTHIKHPSEDESEPSDTSEYGDFSHSVDCRGLLQRLQFDPENANKQWSVIHTGLCRPHSLMEFARLGKPEWLEDETKTVPPIVIKRGSLSTGFNGLLDSLFSVLSKAAQIQSPIRGRIDDVASHDVIFLSSDGSLSSLSNMGNENWRVNAEVSWLQISRTIAANPDTTDARLRDLYHHQFRPSLWAIDLATLGQDTSWSDGMTLTGISSFSTTLLSALVVVGWDSLSLVDRHSGTLLATHKLPGQPIGKPINIPSFRTQEYPGCIGDCSISSLFVIPFDGMLIAFGVTAELRVWTLLLSPLCLFLSFFLLSALCKSTIEFED
ncbi:hypothetical protein EG68_06512 [Paragonimus skrjabini miyazakii]|uniref:Uncharacterized protein n=1 Tax=Paragonimus skrjabini miyazakii TaxID=59628 RepID=A0A8S9YT11_9TREM|nr:hypothetical protein EG68_06512 [Paragonimus skrjabini miyazakii]